MCTSFPVKAEDCLSFTYLATIKSNPDESSSFGDNLENQELSFNYRWLTTDCAGYYNRDLAVFASLLATDIYETVCVAINDEDDVYADEETGLLQTAIGLDDYEYILIGDNDVDTLDTTELGIAHKIVNVDGNKYNVFFATICGTRNENEWRSNVDTGNVSEFGELHPDWRVKENHKGFDVAATRTKKAIDKYIEDNSLSDAQNTILLTGHSRGGAIASILGTYYEKDNKINSYTYTFSSPMNTTINESNAKSYKTIFNLANQDDFITTIPLAYWDFTRYGRDITIPADKKDSFALLTTTCLGFDYVAPDVEALDDSFKSITSNRDDLYEDYYLTTSIENKEDINEFIIYSAAGDYWTIFEEDTVNVTYKYKKQYLLNTLSIIIANRDQSLGSLFAYLLGLLGLMQYAGESDLLETLIQTLTADAAKIGTPHYCACSYAMAQTIPSMEKTEDHEEIRGAYAPTNLYPGYTGDKYCMDCNKLLEVGNQIPALGQIDLKNTNVKLDYYYSEYTGNNKKPKVTLFYNDEVVPSEYYSVSYLNNKEIGTATVIVEAIEEDIPYKGSIIDKFYIIEKEAKEENKENNKEENEPIQEPEINQEEPQVNEDINKEKDSPTNKISPFIYVAFIGVAILLGLVIIVFKQKNITH